MEIFELSGIDHPCNPLEGNYYVDISIPQSFPDGYAIIIEGLEKNDFFLKIFDKSNKSLSFNKSHGNILRITPFMMNGNLKLSSNLLNQNFSNHSWIRLISNNFFDFKKIIFSSDLEFMNEIELKINLHSGLGDCLRVLSLHPSISGHNKFAKIKIFYTYAALGMQNNNWGSLLKSDILGRNPIFEYLAENDFISSNAIEITNGNPASGNLYFKDYFPEEYQGFVIPMTIDEEREVLGLQSNGNVKIGIQLSGNDPKKHYDVDLRINLLRLILQKYPESEIFLFDKPGYFVDNRLLFDKRIINLVGKVSMAQACNLIRMLDLWVAPDSYSKYIRNWEGKKQLILCTTLPYISNEDMLRYCFNNVGLCFNKKVKLLGASYDSNLENISIVDDINLISPEEIVEYL